MTRRRRANRAPSTRWQQVRVGVRCAFGDEIGPGAWAYFGPAWQGRHAAICEAHMREHYGMARPPRPVVLTQDFDVRARRAGERE